MKITLTPELESFVSAEISSGRYHSVSEVVCAALKLLEEHDRGRQTQIDVFNQELGHRLASLDRGEWVSPATARNRIESNSRARKELRD